MGARGPCKLPFLWLPKATLNSPNSERAPRRAPPDRREQQPHHSSRAAPVGSGQRLPGQPGPRLQDNGNRSQGRRSLQGPDALRSLRRLAQGRATRLDPPTPTSFQSCSAPSRKHGAHQACKPAELHFPDCSEPASSRNLDVRVRFSEVVRVAPLDAHTIVPPTIPIVPHASLDVASLSDHFRPVTQFRVGSARGAVSETPKLGFAGAARRRGPAWRPPEPLPR